MADDLERTLGDATGAYRSSMDQVEAIADALRVDEDTQRLLGVEAPDPLGSPVELQEND